MLKHLRFLALVPVALCAQTKDEAQRPKEAERPVVIQLEQALKNVVPKHSLPPGYELSLIAGAPLVQHPIMGCLDDQGNLYVGDAVGVNWNKEQLEKAPPNRVLKLIDTNGDGFYDKSVVFADHMTFPQGACWVKDSLFVASPPGIWKLTDKDGDGVAEHREMIVGGFDYTGNAADVHGPHLHPNGRIYWCHGRKGHLVTQKDGTLVHEGKASGIWSCLPDGSDVRWHALGGADNPTGLAFTNRGEILGTTNLYKSQPRSDTLMLWQYGGIYPRRDQMQVVENLPMTFIDMPSLYDFGHVAVSGTSFWGGYSDEDKAPLMVTHFNTQRLVRMELEESGSAYQLSQHEFLKIHSDDVHLTDVFEDPKDASLILLNTGGWFRIGCPSSLMAKPEQLGSIYRIKRTGNHRAKPYVAQERFPTLQDAEQALTQSKSLSDQRIAMEYLLEHLEHTKSAPALGQNILDKLRSLAKAPQDEYLLQAWLRLSRHLKLYESSALAKVSNEDELKHLLLYFRASSGDTAPLITALLPFLNHEKAEIQALTLETLSAYPESASKVGEVLLGKLQSTTPETLKLIEDYLEKGITHAESEAKKLLSALLSSPQEVAVTQAIRLLSNQAKLEIDPEWKTILVKRLDTHPSLELMEVVARIGDSEIQAKLQSLSEDHKLGTTLRIKALASLSKKNPSADTLAWLSEVLSASSSESLASKITAAKTLAKFQLNPDQLTSIAPLFAQLGPIELSESLSILRKSKDAQVLKPLCVELAKNPALLSQQESFYRNQLSHSDPELFEKIIAPAYRSAELALAKKQSELDQLAKDALTQGKVEQGKLNFNQGKGSCIACHRVGDLGGIVGPNLSQIGGIRKERDLLESIIFPNNTLARDYETQVFELRSGESVMGVVRSHAAEGIIIADVAGQTRTLPHDQIVSQVTLPSSLMPMGLENTMTRQEMLDMIAFLLSQK